MRLKYHLLNVFTCDAARLSGNPLCVFEDGRALEGTQMQALARQFNLSETTFLLPAERASSAVRIFTPDFEMAFAGHPTLGSAFVVRLLGCRDPVITLAMPAGVIEVAEQHGRWRLTAPPAQHRDPTVTRAALAAALGLGSDDILWHNTGARPLWVNSGSDQFMVPLASAAAVQRAAPNVSRFDALVSSEGRRMAYVFAPKTHTNNSILSRFFFEADGSLREDPATGSACANLGGWLLATGTRAPIGLRVDQGAQIRRPSTLWLELDAERRVHVGGDIAHLGSGEIEI